MRITTIAAALFALAGAAAADDDLTLIKRAVAQDAKADNARPKVAAATATKTEPRWLKVRIQPRDGRGGKVSVNLPLAFVKAVGNDWPIAHGRGFSCGSSGEGLCLRLGEALKLLEAGQEIVTVENEDNEIRVWVE